MEKLILALGPTFAAGFAIQQFIELFQPLTQHIKHHKKLLLSACSLVIGLVLSFGAGLRVLEPLGATNAGIFDPLVTALIISAGTEGLNSVMKFLGYAKDAKYNQAAEGK